MRDTYVLSILDKALNDDYGIEVQAGSPKTFRQYCFSARKRYREQTGDDRYESLIIRFAPHDPENLLYIMKQEYLDNARIYGKVSGEE